MSTEHPGATVAGRARRRRERLTGACALPTLGRCDRPAAHPQPRPGPRARRLLRVFEGPAVTSRTVALLVPDRRVVPTLARREEPCSHGSPCRHGTPDPP